jgi:ankyrin repeat protein
MPKKQIQPVAATPNTQALTRVYAWFSAIEQEDMALLEDLLAHGVPVDVSHPLRHTSALMEAARRGRARTVEWLLVHGAAPAFLCGMPLGTPLHSALRRRHWAIAHRLLAAMENAAVMDGYGRTPLHILCMEAESHERSITVPLAEAILQKKCPLDALDHEGITALHHCVINDAADMARLLLRNGANANTLIPDSWVSPLAIAALEKNRPMARLLMEYGANPQLTTREGSSPATLWPAILA